MIGSRIDAHIDAHNAATPTAGARIADARERLLAWFDAHKRDLPWRRDRDPYRVWVSEIMLQQTQVATVVPYFERFLERFPDPRTLAEASEDEVLRLWEGLGYYRRGRMLHEAARRIVERHAGVFPREPGDVRALPGVGRYTAGAILSIALDLREPVLEGNTIRLHARWTPVTDDVTTKPALDRLWQVAGWWSDGRRPGDVNQALMELGSQVCTPRSPRCGECPLRETCEGVRAGDPARLPRKSRKVRFEDVCEAVVILHRRGRFLIRRCGADERWAGLWDFPRFRVDADVPLAEQVRRSTGLRPQLVDSGDEIRHAVTRFRIRLECHVAVRIEGRLRRSLDPTLRWVDEDELRSLPLSVTGRKLAGRLERYRRAAQGASLE